MLGADPMLPPPGAQPPPMLSPQQGSLTPRRQGQRLPARDGARTSVRLCSDADVGEQPAQLNRSRELAPLEGGRDIMACRQGDKLIACAVE